MPSKNHAPPCGKGTRKRSTKPPAPKGDAPNAETAAEQAPQPSTEAIREALADNLRDMTGASFLYCSAASSLSDGFDPHAFKVYRDKLLQDAGNPTDPIETMLIEQLALAHFNIGRLQMKSCSVDNAKLAVAYSDAATRLLGEFRRCTLALEDFRVKQAVRKAQTANVVVETESAAKPNGKPRLSTNGKKSSRNGRKQVNGQKKAMTAKLTNTGDIPQCLKDRMQPPMPCLQ